MISAGALHYMYKLYSKGILLFQEQSFIIIFFIKYEFLSRIVFIQEFL